MDDGSSPQVYRPDGEVLRRFLRNDDFVQIIQGPWGSGKSVGAGHKLWKYIVQQKPGPTGLRVTRWVVVRNTYQQLADTTIKTWLDWFPEHEYGQFLRTRPFRHMISLEDVRSEVIFLALDDQDDRRKLLSLEFTGAWVNEIREVPKELIDDLTGRAGRFPRQMDGGPTWWGLIGDTNAPAPDHWLPIMRGDVPAPEWMGEEQVDALKKPDNWSFFMQPPAMFEDFDTDGRVVGYRQNVDAENLRYLVPGYYENLVKGKTKTWIDMYVLNRVGLERRGKPVYTGFRKDRHVARSSIQPLVGYPILVGLDFGRQPAAIMGQFVRGRWFILREFLMRDVGTVIFAPRLKAELAQRFPGYKFQFWGDPSGDYRGQANEQTPFMVLRAQGLSVMNGPTQDISIRLQAVEGCLGRDVDGTPGILIDPSCTTLINGFEAGYRYKETKPGESHQASLDPVKDQYSNPHDALQYLLTGAGEGRQVTLGRREAPKQGQSTQRKWDPWSRSVRPGTGRAR